MKSGWPGPFRPKGTEVLDDSSTSARRTPTPPRRVASSVQPRRFPRPLGDRIGAESWRPDNLTDFDPPPPDAA